MADKPPVSQKEISPDWFLRGALTRIGDTIDRFTGRRWVPSSSLATSELSERLKKLLDSEAKEVPGKGRVVPHNITLKMQWDKFSTDSKSSLEKLENELLAAVADHINDSLYYTFAPLSLRVKPDYFTEGVKLFASFESFSDEDEEAQMNVTLPVIAGSQSLAHTVAEPAPAKAEVYIARFELKGSRRDKRFEILPKGRITVGRSGGNDLFLDDSSVSKLHAALVADLDGVLAVADTGSTNGTFINGERISYGKAIELAEGDRVKFGEVEVIFEHIPSPAEPVGTETDTTEIGGMTFSSADSNKLPDPAKMVPEIPDPTAEIHPRAEADAVADESEVTN